MNNEKTIERIMERIDREQTKLDNLNAKKDEMTAAYNKKLAEVSESIKEQETIIANLREQEKNEKLLAVAAMMYDKGVSVDDLYAATANNDLFGIQEKIEGGTPAASTPAAPAAKPVVEEDKPEIAEVEPASDEADVNETTDANESESGGYGVSYGG